MNKKTKRPYPIILTPERLAKLNAEGIRRPSRGKKRGR